MLSKFCSMDLFEKSLAVEAIFQELEEESKQFHREAGMSCISGCGFCCSNPEVPASPLEFLPLAFDLYKKGQANELADQLSQQENTGICVVYRSNTSDISKGFCGNYLKRGLICRLFGASARRNNKTGLKELITCKILKAEKNKFFQTTTERINFDMDIALAPAYYTRITDVDEVLAQQYPINRAILIALELVLRYYYYTKED